ncbi:MAG: hypothetical protein QG656_476 [Candidatus Hydrogenedentes bacterium]|nr:hypothetical protein [Candidatus Hydrogenedentota bacterium]
MSDVLIEHVSLPLATVLLSASPILELRGALPFAILAGLPLWAAYPLAVVGNMLPIPFLIWLLGPATDLLRRWPRGDRFVEWLFARTRRQGERIERYEMWGLVLCVALPLPMAGAWTGAVAGHVFGFSKAQTLGACFIGVCIIGGIMSALSVFARELFVRFFGV